MTIGGILSIAIFIIFILLIVDLIVRLDDYKGYKLETIKKLIKIEPEEVIIKKENGNFYKKVYFNYLGKNEEIDIPIFVLNEAIYVNVLERTNFYNFKRVPLLIRLLEGSEKERSKSGKEYYLKQDKLKFELVSKE
jgi:hypothetical protein